MIDFCPVCKRDTVHIVIEDDIFDHAIQCVECHTVWEAEMNIQVVEIQRIEIKKKETKH